MLNRIFKYYLPTTPNTIIHTIPLVEVLNVKEQENKAVLYVVADTDIESKNYKITCRWTGNYLNGDYGRYIGTIEVLGLMCHYFIEEV